MTERLRCEECKGHIAYACDKILGEAVVLSLLDEVIDQLPARELSVVDNELRVTEHRPDTAFAIDEAVSRRAHQYSDVLDELHTELGCDLSLEQLHIALYEATDEIRQADPAGVQEMQLTLTRSIKKFLNNDMER